MPNSPPATPSSNTRPFAAFEWMIALRGSLTGALFLIRGIGCRSLGTHPAPRRAQGGADALPKQCHKAAHAGGPPEGRLGNAAGPILEDARRS